MAEIPKRVGRTLDRIKKEELGYFEIKVIKGKYYVYQSTSEYDKEKKKPRKITTYVGAIKTDGMYVRKKKRSTIIETKREIFEYANCELAYHFLKDVEEILQPLTPHYREIIASAIIKAIDPKPIRLYSSRWEKFSLSNQMEVNLSPKRVSSMLKNLGKEISVWYELFSKLTPEKDFLLYDLSAVSTYSQNCRLAEKGYNAHHEYIDQIGVVMAFSTKNCLPVGIEVYFGSIKDIKTIKDFLDKYPNRNIGFVFDRGFTSYKLLERFRKEKVNYVVPLKKNSKYMDLRWIRWRKPFSYRNRPIRWAKKKTDLGNLYIFEDPKLKGDEESALLRRVTKEKLSMSEFEEKRKVAGIIGIMSDLDKDGIEIFDVYKGREDVELAFDTMKNHMDSDKTYLQSAEATRGYFFITFLAMRVYFSILKRLREKKLTNKISVDEVLFELSKVMLIQEKNGRKYLAQIPKRAHRMLSLFPEAIPMG